jgi:RNA processing factor Prp31
MTRNPIAQLASLGEEVLDKASQNPTTARVVNAAVQLKDRVDDLAKRVRGLESLDQRLAQLEERVAELEGKSAKKPAAKKTPPPAAAETSGTDTPPAS